MRVELLFPSRYLKAVDLDGKPLTLTIVAVAVEELQMQGGKKERKPVVYFEENAEKALVMNKTNALAIAAQHGPETDAWTGKRITLIPARDRMGGKLVDCIRIQGQGQDQPQKQEVK